ncbi:hypothetical protein O181_094516 [Austropuccinia psidii MF-1]|uniref:Uncharacterized protein n=1 Tax=Austropuccinia psidii MF-1 TaxID=1389203 RepID=A0A9Q3J3D6_9BASI|nr:hypothetical protein [Austropuccinia psidii MF-1]
MPVQHSPPARKTRSQTRAQAVLTPNPRAPLDGNPEVPQLRAHLDRGPNMEGAAPSRKQGRGSRRSSPGEDNEEEEEESDGTEAVPAPVGDSEGAGGLTLDQSNQPVSNQSETSLLSIMQKMTQIMANIQAASFSEASKHHL